VEAKHNNLSLPVMIVGERILSVIKYRQNYVSARQGISFDPMFKDVIWISRLADLSLVLLGGW
jgi:hypothetical protein